MASGGLYLCFNDLLCSKSIAFKTHLIVHIFRTCEVIFFYKHKVYKVSIYSSLIGAFTRALFTAEKSLRVNCLKQEKIYEMFLLRIFSALKSSLCESRFNTVSGFNNHFWNGSRAIPL